MEKRKINFTDNDTRKTKISQSQKARYKRINQHYVNSQLHEEYNADMSSLESLEDLLAKISGRIANQFLMICDLIAENPPRTDPVHRLRLTLLAIFCLTHKTKIIMTLSKLAFGRDFLYIVLSSWLTTKQ